MLCKTVRKGKLYRMHISIYNTPQILRVLASFTIILRVLASFTIIAQSRFGAARVNKYKETLLNIIDLQFSLQNWNDVIR